MVIGGFVSGRRHAIHEEIADDGFSRELPGGDALRHRKTDRPLHVLGGDGARP